ncbi:MAG: endonuclease V [Candidatus Zixiibacteriota bacterium]
MAERSLIHQLRHHPWSVTVRRAAEIQSSLATHVSLTPLTGPPTIVAGMDTAERNGRIFVAIVVMEASSGKVIEIQYESGVPHFPYLPGYRAFRDGPIMQKAVAQLRHDPQLYFIVGQGVCHPRACGLATHIGLRLDIPTIGCARERLVGHYDPPGENRGDYAVIRYSPQAPGVVLRTREGTKPIFVSPGHRIDLLGAIEQTLRFCTPYRIPEPLRRAHIEAGRHMRQRTLGMAATRGSK